MNLETLLQTDAKIISFDVFDTVLTRSVGTPKGIFALMQKQLNGLQISISEELYNHFHDLRVEAEKEARKKSPEVTLQDIYQIIQNRYALPESVTHSLINLEMTLENDHIAPVRDIVFLLDQLRKDQRRIVFVSDMYLSTDFIKHLLKKVGAYQEGDGLYVSQEYKKSKVTGDLFKEVFHAEQCLPSDIIHIGDNFHSDYLIPKGLGVRCVHFKLTKLNRYEENMIQVGSQNISKQTIFNKLAGASRLARLDSLHTAMDKQLVYSLGATMAGPILLGYVLWLLKEAKKRNIKRLYFLSRDGQILFEIAKKLIQKDPMDIELRYLYGSRQAWFLPAVVNIDEYELTWMLSRDPIITLEIVAERISCDVQVLQNKMSSLMNAKIKINKDLDREEIKILKQCIQSKEITLMILEKAKERRSDLINYLKQEGLFEDVNWAMVDLGWFGRLQSAIRKILDLEGLNKKSITGFYFGLNRVTQDIQPTYDHRVAYFFNSNQKNAFLHVGQKCINLLEILTAADHGMTINYRLNAAKKWEPVLKEDKNSAALDWGIQNFHQGIYAFMDQVPEELLKDFEQYEEDYKILLLDMMGKLVWNPHPEEADAISSYLFSCDQTETKLRSIAPALSITQALYIAFTRDLHNGDKKILSLWMEGSIARSPMPVRSIIEGPLNFPLRILGNRYFKVFTPKGKKESKLFSKE